MKEARQKKDILHDFIYVKFQKIPLYNDRKVSGCRGGGLLGARWERRDRREGLLRGKKKRLVMMEILNYLGCDNAFKTHQIVHFIHVQFIVYHLYLNKAEKPSILKAFKRKIAAYPSPLPFPKGSHFERL